MTDVTSTPPALRWVALFLAACAVLGLFLGFRDQIRKNPPDWFTGAAGSATLLPAASDGAREATAFNPDAPATPVTTSPSAALQATPPRKTDPAAAETSDTAPETDRPAPAKAIAPPVLTPQTIPSPPVSAPRARPAPKAAPAPADPVGDILEGQKQTEAPAAVPY